MTKAEFDRLVAALVALGVREDVVFDLLSEQDLISFR